jgi:hypothetical protein
MQVTGYAQSNQARTGRKAWSVAVALVLLLQGLFAGFPAGAAGGFALDAASICSSVVKVSGEADQPHDPAAPHCPLCQNLQPSLGLSPPAIVAVLPQAKPAHLAGHASPIEAKPFQPVGFLSRAPPIFA